MVRSTPRFRYDRRPLGLLLLIGGVLVIGLLISWFPDSQELSPDPSAASIRQTQSPSVMQQSRVQTNRVISNEPDVITGELPGHFSLDDPLRQRLDSYFQQGVVMLHAKRYDYALVALNQVIAIAPLMPEAYVNIGYAMLGQERYTEASEAFQFAIDLRPEQPNAYYGLAIALDVLQDRVGALGAMYSYLHRAADDAPYRRKAAAAIWEWEALPNDNPSNNNKLEAR